MKEGKVVAFAPRAFTDTEKQYANIEREVLAGFFFLVRNFTPTCLARGSW